jgi:hypothetical protein
MPGSACPTVLARPGISRIHQSRRFAGPATVLAASFALAAPALGEGARSPWQVNDALDLKLPVLLALVVLATLIYFLIGVARRNPNLYIRPLAGIKAIEEAVGRATEMGRPVIYIPGVDDINNIQTIYSMMILEKVATMVAKYGTPLLVPVASAFVTPVAEETVKQGYLNAGVPENFNPNNIRYMSNEQFAFTAATNGMILRERPAASLLMGSFYAESLLMAETGFRAGAIQIAGTANIHQLPFFVVACDYTLIGEEFYVATAYLSREAGLVGTIKAQDYFKAGLLVILVMGAAGATLAVNLGLPGWLNLSSWLNF